MTDQPNTFSNTEASTILDPPTIAVAAPNGKRLLTLNVEDGRLVATYDEADLDEAARIFLREVVRLSKLV